MVVFKYNSLFKSFYKQEFKSKYVSSIGGVIWVFIPQIVNIIVYVFVFSYILKVRINIETMGTDQFAVFLMSALLPWLAFADSLNQSSHLLLSKSSIISKVSFPVHILPYVSSLVVYSINGLGFLIFLAYLSYSGHFDSSWIYIFPVIIMQLLFSLGLVAFFSSLSLFFRDLSQIVTLMVSVWFFATPIIYPVSLIPENLQPLMQLNPFYYFVEAYRDILLLHTFSMDLFSILLLISLPTYLMGGWFFVRIKHAFGDVI